MIPRRRLPPLNALRAFEVAGRRLSFRAAADELGVTQGAVAQQIRLLEGQLGLPLFHRLARGLSLTAEGCEALADLSRTFDLMGAAVDRLAEKPARVTISATPTVATRLLIPRLAELQAAVPGVSLRTIAEEDLPDFDRDDVDIGIGLARPPFASDIEAQLLIPQHVVALAAPRLVQGMKPWLNDSELTALPLLHHCQNHWPQFLGQSGPLAGPSSI